MSRQFNALLRTATVKKNEKSFDRSFECDSLKCNNLFIAQTSNGIGVNTTASNLGSTGGRVGVFNSKVLNDLQFKSLVGTGTVTLTNNSPAAGEIEINSVGEANTSSNLGGGVGLAQAKVGINLPFRSLVAGANIVLTPTVNDVTISSTGVEDLATTLATGNTTGGTDIILSTGDIIEGENAAPASGLAGSAALINGGNGDGAGAPGAVTLEPGTGTGNPLVNIQSNAAATSILTFRDLNNSNFVGFRSAAVVGSNVTWTLPSIDATVSGQQLSSNAAGILSWTDAEVLLVNNTTFVDGTNGNDGTGTVDRLDLPFATIGAAITAATAGDLIHVRPGTYAETLTISKDLDFFFDEGTQITTSAVITITGGVTVHINGSLEVNGTHGFIASIGANIVVMELRRIETVNGDALTLQNGTFTINIKEDILCTGGGVPLTSNATIAITTIDMNVGQKMESNTNTLIQLIGSSFQVKGQLTCPYLLSADTNGIRFRDNIDFTFNANLVENTASSGAIVEVRTLTAASVANVKININRIFQNRATSTIVPLNLNNGAGGGSMINVFADINIIEQIATNAGLAISYGNVNDSSYFIKVGRIEGIIDRIAIGGSSARNDDAHVNLEIGFMQGSYETEGGVSYAHIIELEGGSVAGRNVITFISIESTSAYSTQTLEIDRLTIASGSRGDIEFEGTGVVGWRGKVDLKIRQVEGGGSVRIDTIQNIHTDSLIMADITNSLYDSIDIPDNQGNIHLIMRPQDDDVITITGDCTIANTVNGYVNWDIYGDLTITGDIAVTNGNSFFIMNGHGLTSFNSTVTAPIFQSAVGGPATGQIIINFEAFTVGGTKRPLFACDDGNIYIYIKKWVDNTTTSFTNMEFRTGNNSAIGNDEGVSLIVLEGKQVTAGITQMMQIRPQSGTIKISMKDFSTTLDIDIIRTGALVAAATGRVIMYDSYVGMNAAAIADASTLFRISSTNPVAVLLLKNVLFAVNTANLTGTVATHDGFLTVDAVNTLTDFLLMNNVVTVDNISGGAGAITTTTGGNLPTGAPPGTTLFGGANYGAFDTIL